MEEKARVELLKSVYEQHWLHARHCENERLWFTNVFALIVAGLFAFLGTAEQPILSQFVTYAGCTIFLLSMLGYFLCLTWRGTYLEHVVLAVRMIGDPYLKRYAPYTAEVYNKIKRGLFTSHEVYLSPFSLMTSVGLFLILYIGLTSCYWWTCFIPSIVMCIWWFILGARRENKYRQGMGVSKW